MPQEIERKFLLANDSWRDKVDSKTSLKQGYLSSKKEATVRIRLENNSGILAIKGKTEGVTRSEFEYIIPVEEAEQLLLLCEKQLIEKTRHIIRQGVHTWEIDEFEGENQGLIIAEIELKSEDEYFVKPTWLGEEVSEDARYYNACLVTHPYSKW